jgi:hypothetical protein
VLFGRRWCAGVGGRRRLRQASASRAAQRSASRDSEREKLPSIKLVRPEAGVRSREQAAGGARRRRRLIPGGRAFRLSARSSGVISSSIACIAM